MIPPCLTLSNIRYVSRVKWSNPGKEVVPSPTPRCSSYWKGSLLVALNYSCQLYFYLYKKHIHTQSIYNKHIQTHVRVCAMYNKHIHTLYMCNIFINHSDKSNFSHFLFVLLISSNSKPCQWLDRERKNYEQIVACWRHTFGM